MDDMKVLSTQLRKSLMRQRREMYRESEDDFAQYLYRASKAMPARANEPMFAFIIRQLWEPHDGNMPPNWLQVLPKLYDDYCRQHSWVLKETEVKGTAVGGLRSLARLLCALRSRQRDLEGRH